MAQELGRCFDAQRVSASDECRRNEGAVGVLAQALDGVEALRPHYKSAAQQGEIAAESGHLAMVVLDEVSGCLRNLKLAAEHNMIAQRGKMAQIEQVLDACQSAFDSEITAVSEVEAALKEAESQEGKDNAAASKKPTKKRTVGEHPGAPIAERKAEAQT
jgi:hypothetical protein